MKTNKNKTDVQCVISFRADKETKKRIESAAKRIKSSKSSIVRLALSRILDEADRGKITLLPIEK
jgi:predicted transcriptional regulator